MEKLLKTQFKLGFYDNPLTNKFSKYNEDSIHNNAHIELAKKVAEQSIVLLKNEHHLLPFTKDKYESIMIVGPNATSYDA